MAIDIYSNLSGVKIGATGVEEIIQNVQIILSTNRGSVPLDRDFGLDNIYLDQPDKLVMARIVPEIFEEVEKQEPRVKVLEVDFVEQENNIAAEGRLFPKVRVEIL